MLMVHTGFVRPAAGLGHRFPAVRISVFCFLLSWLAVSCQPKTQPQDEFVRLTNQGKNAYDRGDAVQALPAFEQALRLNPTQPDAQLNLAVAALAANQPEKTLQHAQEVLNLDRNSGAAYFVIGCADLRLGRPKEAVQALQQAKELDRTINAVSFQLGRAYQQMGNYEAAAQEFQELTQFEPEHPAAHYALSQVWLRLGKNEEANQELAAHQKITAGKAGQAGTPSAFERCQYTQIRLPFQLEQPEARGIAVAFHEATGAAFGANAPKFQGPVGVLDLNHDGHNSLFVREGEGFRMLLNTNGTFQPQANLMPGIPGAKYFQALVGDLNNDRYEDLVLLGNKGSQVFKFATNAAVTDISKFSRLAEVAGVDGFLADLDFTAKLDLLLITPGTNAVRVLRNLGNPYFTDNTTNSGVPLSLAGARQLVMEDWNNDELEDLFITRNGQPPLLLIKQRGGGLLATNLTADWPAASLMAAADLNNDMRADVVLTAGDRLVCIFNGLKERLSLPLGNWPVTGLYLVDYDNDGWLDIIAAGEGVRAWRNLGSAGFAESTRQLGLDQAGKARVGWLALADFDRDGDTDLLLASEAGGLRLLRNDGGNANAQLKVQLLGNKSNASGLGIRLELAAGNLRLTRRINRLPVELGVGRYRQVESLTARWFDVNLNYAEVKVDPQVLLAVEELTLPTGSCPYFYAWDGRRFRFVTDILGAAPAGLRLSDTRFVEADPEEYVGIGDETMLQPRGGDYLLAITSELREVLYLDEAKLVVVDHRPGTEVHTTGKMLPGKPFPPHQLVTLGRRYPLLQAVTHEGKDVTARLQESDGKLVSPAQLRIPQLRGLAEPHSVTLDFGPLPVERPLVLALTGWLRFGGGMVNVAASHHPDLPFPFPRLEVETAGGEWRPLEVTVGAPAGKTKTILVDLSGKLPPGSRRLRLGTAYEIHWDRIALFEPGDNARARIARLAPSATDLHWHGYGPYEDWPWYYPLTPIHDRPSATAKWTITPTGWCTRYGEVGPLIAGRDNALALVNGGDELLLKFHADALPPKPPGTVRDFFLYTVGWEKDSDFHCELGWQVDPIPWHGMDDQQYGRQPRPAFPEADALMAKYNTRWVGPYTLVRKNQQKRD
jgi:Flp pilus assembly protein TadD